MEASAGRPEIVIGLIDGPVALDHEDFAGAAIRQLGGRARASCARDAGLACVHGTLVAGVLAARRGSGAPAICPGCTLLVRPIFSDAALMNGRMPIASPEDVAAAIIEVVDAGARIINLSAALMNPSPRGERELARALDFAFSRGVITVAAAGNQGLVTSSAIVRHAAVIPVAACDARGRPLPESNLAHSIARRGLSAPGEAITSLAIAGGTRTFGGTSAATPLVSGTAGLLWSRRPLATAAHVRWAVTRPVQVHSRTIVPPMLDAVASDRALSSVVRGT
jgi:subtilisin family serine protease